MTESGTMLSAVVSPERMQLVPLHGCDGLPVAGSVT
jgi:hypothetical protein